MEFCQLKLALGSCFLLLSHFVLRHSHDPCFSTADMLLGNVGQGGGCQHPWKITALKSRMPTGPADPHPGLYASWGAEQQIQAKDTAYFNSLG